MIFDLDLTSLFYHWHSIVERGGCFQWCLFVCLFVSLLNVNTITSEQLNVGWVRWIVQKSC